MNDRGPKALFRLPTSLRRTEMNRRGDLAVFRYPCGGSARPAGGEGGEAAEYRKLANVRSGKSRRQRAAPSQAGSAVARPLHDAACEK